MEVHFQNSYLQRLCEGLPVSGKARYNDEVIEKFRKKVLLISKLDSTLDLQKYKGLHFKALKGDKQGLYSIRIDRRYRLEFAIEENKITLLEIILITDLSNHYW